MFTYSNQHLSAYQPGVRALDQSSSQQWDAEESPVRFFMFSATDDIPRADEVKTLIKDIWDLRMAKLRSSIDVFVKSDATYAKVRMANMYSSVTPHMQRCIWQICIVLYFCMLLLSATLKLRWQLHCGVIVPCSVWNSRQLIFLVIFKLKCGIECKMWKGCLKTKTWNSVSDADNL